MKKVAICFIVMLMLGVFGLTLQNIDTPVIEEVVEIIGPGAAYAADPCVAGPHAPPPPNLGIAGFFGPG